MSRKEWTRNVRTGEGLTVEFKRQVPKLTRLARTISAFSNSSGGRIFFGVADDGELRGLKNVDGTLNLVTQVAEFHCDPPVSIQSHTWKPVTGVDILVIEVEEAEEKPVYAVNPASSKDAWPFFRSGCENLPLDKKSIKTMRVADGLHDEEIKHMDRHAIHMLNQLSETPRRTLNQLAKSANISAHRAKKILVHLEKSGWVHGYFNEKRREFSLVVPWKKK